MICKAENCHDCWNRRNKFLRLDIEGGYMGNRSPIFVNLTVQLSVLKGGRLVFDN